MSFDPNNVPLEYLLQPELLSGSDILNILEARCIRVDNMKHLNKEQLLNLFYRVVTPKQQRTNTRRSSGSSEHHENLNKKFKKINIEIASNQNSSQGIINKNNQTNGTINNVCDKIQLKRSSNSQTYNDEPSAKKVRQKICWP